MNNGPSKVATKSPIPKYLNASIMTPRAILVDHGASQYSLAHDVSSTLSV
jgi:hypothetical protein